MDQSGRKNNSSPAVANVEQQLSHQLLNYVAQQFIDKIGSVENVRFYTDFNGNTYLEEGELVSHDPNIAMLVNSINILMQGHIQSAPWKTPSGEEAGKSRVLVVDDEASVRAMLKAVLEDCIDSEIILASRGEEAVKLCREQHPDLVLLDMVMSDMDGFSVAKELRQLGIPFIACTSLTDLKSLQRISEAGCFSFVAKPASFSQIQGMVMTALQFNKQPRTNHMSAHCCEICTARGALSAYLAISPEEAYEVMREMARDNHGNSRDMASIVNHYIEFMAKAKAKHGARLARKDKRSAKKRPS